MLFIQLNLPAAWRPLFQEMSRMGWDLDSELAEIPEWASRAPLIFSNQSGSQCYLSFINVPVWCGNIHQQKGITIVCISQQLPSSLEEAEAQSFPLEANWEAGINDFLTLALS